MKMKLVAELANPEDYRGAGVYWVKHIAAYVVHSRSADGLTFEVHGFTLRDGGSDSDALKQQALLKALKLAAEKAGVSLEPEP